MSCLVDCLFGQVRLLRWRKLSTNMKLPGNFWNSLGLPGSHYQLHEKQEQNTSGFSKKDNLKKGRIILCLERVRTIVEQVYFQLERYSSCRSLFLEFGRYITSAIRLNFEAQIGLSWLIRVYGDCVCSWAWSKNLSCVNFGIIYSVLQ